MEGFILGSYVEIKDNLCAAKIVKNYLSLSAFFLKTDSATSDRALTEYSPLCSVLGTKQTRSLP